MENTTLRAVFARINSVNSDRPVAEFKQAIAAIDNRKNAKAIVHIGPVAQERDRRLPSWVNFDNAQTLCQLVSLTCCAVLCVMAFISWSLCQLGLKGIGYAVRQWREFEISATITYCASAVELKPLALWAIAALEQEIAVDAASIRLVMGWLRAGWLTARRRKSLMPAA